jgi:Plasmid pRiA4b ORF-3-like protein
MAKRKTSSEKASAPSRQPARRAAKPKAELVKKTEAVYQLKITLRGVRPPIWRRVQVKDCSLAELHEVIQVVMGWDSSHLYSFDLDGIEYGDSGMVDSDLEDDSRVKLSQVVRGRSSSSATPTISATTGSTRSSSRRSCRPRRERPIPSASPASGPARRRTSAASGVTWISSTPCATRIIHVTMNSRSGSRTSSTPRRSTSTR